ncbi:MAG: DUF2254 family protein [Neoaquamicrobium sediminum]|uniref:DUF2254 family protein n=1 Tax=Neoaquamicrobium sediminum TaxID=1849104 RepID=UPI00403809BA
MQSYLGGRLFPNADDIPAGAIPVRTSIIGYVRHIDMDGLQQIAGTPGMALYSMAVPGIFVDGRRPLARIASTDVRVHRAIVDCYTIAQDRSFD